jgi:methionyl-tRNA formyltransferase
MKTLPIIFFGSSEFSVYVLKEFLKEYKPVLVVTLKGKPKGRGLKLQPNVVFEFCLKEKLNVIELTRTDADHTRTNADSIYPNNNRINYPNKRPNNESFGCNSGKVFGQNSGNNVSNVSLRKSAFSLRESASWENFKNSLNLIKPIAGIIAGFGKIIPKEIIESFPKGILNVHPSLLPKYRGPNPIREVILNGEKETGVTIFLIDELVDHGPILKQEKIELLGNETYLELEEKLGKLGGKVLREIIVDYLDGKIKAIPQDESQATYTKKISKEDGSLSFDEGYEIWQRKIRALNPWPSTYIKIHPAPEQSTVRGKHPAPESYTRAKHDIGSRTVLRSGSGQSTVRGKHQKESSHISPPTSNFYLLKIFKVEKLDERNLPKEILKKNVGEFFEMKNDLGLRLKDAFVILQEVQLEGRKKMSGREFLNGFRKILNIK